MMYLWLQALHIIAMVAWMAGMLYLPRLFVYHAAVAPDSEASATFKVMEARLLRFIMNPAMVVTLALGIIMLVKNPELLRQGWLHAKLALVLAMLGCHGYLARLRRDFAADANKHSAKFYRVLNEVPTLLLIGIIILAVVKPF